MDKSYTKSGSVQASTGARPRQGTVSDLVIAEDWSTANVVQLNTNWRTCPSGVKVRP
jgi:hypothetical protein